MLLMNKTWFIDDIVDSPASGKREYIVQCYWTPPGQTVPVYSPKYTVPSTVFGSAAKYRDLMCMFGIMSPMGTAQLFADSRVYIDSEILRVESARPSRPANRYGWDADHAERAFVGGYATHVKAGAGPVQLVRTQPSAELKQISESFYPAPTLDNTPAARASEAKKAMRFLEIYEQHVDRRGRVLLLTAFASPLMYLTPHPAMFLFLHGTTGVGKSAIQKAITSMWGTPTDGHINANTTLAAADERLNAINDLPVMLAETGNMDPKALFDMIYNVGASRVRHSKASISSVYNEWRGLAVGSSNVNTLHQIDSYADNATAAATGARMLQVHLPKSTLKDTTHLNELNTLMGTTVLRVGPTVFAPYVLDNYDAVVASLQRHTAGIETIYPEPEHRFWRSFYAAMMVAGEVILDAGMYSVDPHDIDTEVREWLKVNAKALTGFMRDRSAELFSAVCGLLENNTTTISAAGQRSLGVNVVRGGSTHMIVQLNADGTMTCTMSTVAMDAALKRNPHVVGKHSATSLMAMMEPHGAVMQKTVICQSKGPESCLVVTI